MIVLQDIFAEIFDEHPRPEVEFAAVQQAAVAPPKAEQQWPDSDW